MSLRALLLSTVAAATVFAGLGVPARAAPGASSLSNVAVSQAGSTVTVTGTASIADASAESASDPTGDAAFQDGTIGPFPTQGVGLDISSATIERKPEQHEVWFTLGIADPIPNVFTLPEITHYHWLIKVTNDGESVYYLLQAMRMGQYDRPIFPSADPLFRVNACARLASGDPNCFDQQVFVKGVMAGGIVQWHVPAGEISAFHGAEIDPVEVYSTIGFDGATYFTQGGTDSIEVAPYVVGSSVEVAFTDAGDPEATQVFSMPAALGQDGSFVAKVASPGPGDWTVTVRACEGDSRGCGLVQVPLSIS